MRPCRRRRTWCCLEARNDFDGTAALVDSLDLVVSVDTSIAHLAGALGRPVWILLPFAPDWRWLNARADTPWYPTARLFRQSRQDDWGGRACDAVAARTRPSVAMSSDADRIRAAKRDAMRLQEAGDPGADAAWSRVLTLSPGDPEAHYALGQRAGDRGDFAKAAQHFRAALARMPGHPQLRASLAFAQEEAGSLKESESLWRALAADPRGDALQAQAQLARNLFRQRRYDDAQRCSLKPIGAARWDTRFCWPPTAHAWHAAARRTRPKAYFAGH